MSMVAEELGVPSTSPEQVEAEQEVAALGPEQSERAGTPLFFRKPEQRPIAMRSAHATLQSQQVLYLDRKIVAHDLLQAIARVNRTCGPKKCGYVVDYIGVARHLNEALKDYDGEDTEGALIDISVELPKLLDRRARTVQRRLGRLGTRVAEVHRGVEAGGPE
jgi:hypothetical protein